MIVARVAGSEAVGGAVATDPDVVPLLPEVGGSLLLLPESMTKVQSRVISCRVAKRTNAS